MFFYLNFTVIFLNPASIISVSGMYHVKPRIIFISDGHPTENVDSDEADLPINPMHVCIFFGIVFF